MNRVRWTALGAAIGLAGLMVLGSPFSASASMENSHLYGYQNEAEAPNAQEGPLVSVPGVFSLWLNQGFSMQSDGVRLESADIDLPAINATATVDGLRFGLSGSGFGWDNITVKQAAPVQNEALTISGMQASIGGQSENFTTDISTRIDVHPSENLMAGATVALGYDGATGQPSFAVSDGGAQVAVGPATVAVDGLNMGDGAFAVDAAQVVLPDAGVGVRVDGYTVADGQSNWQAFTMYGQEFKLGDVATFSDNLVVVPGPGSQAAASPGAATRFEINAGEAASANGQVVFRIDPTTGQPALASVNANATLGVAGWNLAFNGMNTGAQGTSVDSIVLTAEPLGIQAQVSGINVDATSGMTFDQARFLYRPVDQRTVAGFELVVDSTDAGYIVSTTTLVPTAAK